MNRVFNKVNNNINKKEESIQKNYLKLANTLKKVKENVGIIEKNILCCVETLVRLILMNLIQDKKR